MGLGQYGPAWVCLDFHRRFEVVTSPPLANLSNLFPLFAILGHMESTNSSTRAHVELGCPRIVLRRSVYPRGTSQREVQYVLVIFVDMRAS